MSDTIKLHGVTAVGFYDDPLSTGSAPVELGSVAGEVTLYTATLADMAAALGVSEMPLASEVKPSQWDGTGFGSLFSNKTVVLSAPLGSGMWRFIDFGLHRTPEQRIVERLDKAVAGGRRGFWLREGRRSRWVTFDARGLASLLAHESRDVRMAAIRAIGSRGQPA